jgi:hypothetical protein
MISSTHLPRLLRPLPHAQLALKPAHVIGDYAPQRRTKVFGIFSRSRAAPARRLAESATLPAVQPGGGNLLQRPLGGFHAFAMITGADAARFRDRLLIFLAAVLLIRSNLAVARLM